MELGSRGVLLDRRFSGIFFSIFWVFGDFRDGAGCPENLGFCGRSSFCHSIFFGARFG